MTTLLTVRQPFATAIIRGDKTIENRGRKANYRGRLGIHAGIAVWPDMKDWDVAAAMALPRAAVLGTVNMVGCHRATPGCCDPATGALLPGQYPGSKDVWHLELENPQEFVTPIRHVKGQLGFWTAGPSAEHLMSIAEVVER